MAYTTINKSTDYFNTKLYTGTGSSNAQTGVGFQPDWLWIKKRNGAVNHLLHDAIRGVTKLLVSNSSAPEDTNTNILSSFNSDGFTVGTNSASNGNNDTFVAWNWKANGAGSTNTDGSINSTVSASTTSGFSIVKYTGTGSDMTVGHGLNAVPKMIIVKALTTGTDPWWVYHASLGNSAKLRLNGTQASQTGSDYIWNQTTPTSSVFSLDGANNGSNANGNNFIAYCFAEKQGYSKIGSYKGNGDADGPFIYTGFKPAFVMLKITSAVNDWEIHDNKRGPFNVIDNILQPNTNDGQFTGFRDMDFLSNGFKPRSGSTQNNLSNGSFIYMAFAEAPLVGSNNVPCTAR